MNKIAIVGLGKVGMEYAYALLNSDVEFKEMVLIDVAVDALKSHVLDLNHALVSLNRDIKVKMGSYDELGDADMVCITAGCPQNQLGGSRDSDLFKCGNIFKNIIPSIANSGFNGLYLIASNPLDVMCRVALKYAKCDPNRIIGSGTLLDTNRLLTVIAEKYNKNLFDVKGLVLGEHGETSFVPWSSVNVDVPVEDRDEINQKVKKLGFDIVAGQGFTAYGVSAALLRITKDLSTDTEEVLPVSTYLPEHDIYISTPSKIGRDGVIENNLYNYTESEKADLDKSINKIKNEIVNILHL
jgi:L-lactate dehydrogenase